jgi:hypothetical protein
MEIFNLKNLVDKNFQDILKKKQDCDDELNSTENLIQKIKDKYTELLKTVSHDNVYLGIDSLNFQNKLFDYHLKYLNNMYIMIINRFYGDYYKIYRSIKNYIEINCTAISIPDISFQTYKDLEINKKYDFLQVIKLQNCIHQYIKNINDIIIQKRIKIQKFIESNTQGYIVNYYINEETTNINVHVEKVNSYIKYLEICNLHHNKYLSSFFKQTREFIFSIKNDIHNNTNELMPNIYNQLDKCNQTKEQFEIEQNIKPYIETLIDSILYNVTDTSQSKQKNGIELFINTIDNSSNKIELIIN